MSSRHTKSTHHDSSVFPLTVTRTLQNADGTALFHLDTLFLCLNNYQGPEFIANLAVMPKDLEDAEIAISEGRATHALHYLIDHCHEFVHYHQFVGTQFGLVYRRLLAARARLREQLLQEVGSRLFRELLAAGSRRGKLLEVLSNDRLSVHPDIRNRVDSRLIETLGWFECFDAFLIEGRYSELFALPTRIATLLEACATLTDPYGTLNLGAFQERMKASTEPTRPQSSSALFPICEAQATLNEIALHPHADTESAQMRREQWTKSRYWDLLKRFGLVPSSTSEDLQRISSAVLLATDIALDGIKSPSLHGNKVGTLVLHPNTMIDTLVACFNEWREVLDSPLQHWNREGFMARRDHAVAAAMKSPSVASLFFAIPQADQEPSRLRTAHPMVQYVGIFSSLMDKICKVREADPSAALFPVGVIRERPSAFLTENGTNDNEHLKNLICPFLSVGGETFSNHIDDETWMRWRLLAGYELWLDNFFNTSDGNFARLPESDDLVAELDLIATKRIDLMA